jgi:hypothetical protein
MGNCRNTHICFESCCHCLCDELIMRTLVTIYAFNTCMNLTLILEVEVGQATNVLDAFDVDLIIF